MIGFVAAITASLAVIILVVIASLIGFVQSIMPTTGVVKIDEFTYRYNLKTPYVDQEILQELVLTVSDMSFSDRIQSYQNGCNFGFNANEKEMKRIATYNYIMTHQFFAGSYPVDHINIISQNKKMNSCFIDIHVLRDLDAKRASEEKLETKALDQDTPNEQGIEASKGIDNRGEENG